MNRRIFIILLSAFLIAVACSYLVFRLVGHRLAGSHAATTRVVAAAADIKLGSVLKSSDLTTVEISGTLPKGVVLKREDAIGRGVISDLYQGEPILESRLAAPGSGGGLAATIPQGMRAAAIKVNEVVGVAGFVTPGMRVDVVVSGTPPGQQPTSAQGSMAKTLLQNIQVLSAGTDIQRDAEGKPQQVQVVNLLVSPEQAEILSLASNEARIQLVLRNPLDTQIATPPVTNTAELYSGASVPVKSPVVYHKPAPKAADTSRVYVVEVLNGSKKTEAKFPSGEEKQ
ncbi:pilus assembly-related, exported protein [Edaphobacter acidisoli]|uniref:Pilus assembly-related, exported protein n=1 Tax=Edaphobacter acidisoli TaxID=2040573 RepID=A0A916RME4_9BACT|nr:Flp pilus assembly protein CpaB [Edaphobacter acidisoli]GGA62610.1 pilus assembly-related, exported protein [Edaphobacter acidisoli]